MFEKFLRFVDESRSASELQPRRPRQAKDLHPVLTVPGARAVTPSPVASRRHGGSTSPAAPPPSPASPSAPPSPPSPFCRASPRRRHGRFARTEWNYGSYAFGSHHDLDYGRAVTYIAPNHCRATRTRRRHPRSPRWRS